MLRYAGNAEAIVEIASAHAIATSFLFSGALKRRIIGGMLPEARSAHKGAGYPRSVR
jgi:hypothetical protein